MVCGKQTKQIASHVAIHTCNQLNCIVSFYTKSRSVFLKQLTQHHFSVEDDSIMFEHDM